MIQLFFKSTRTAEIMTNIIKEDMLIIQSSILKERACDQVTPLFTSLRGYEE